MKVTTTMKSKSHRSASNVHKSEISLFHTTVILMWWKTLILSKTQEHSIIDNMKSHQCYNCSTTTYFWCLQFSTWANQVWLYFAYLLLMKRTILLHHYAYDFNPTFKITFGSFLKYMKYFSLFCTLENRSYNTYQEMSDQMPYFTVHKNATVSDNPTWQWTQTAL